MEILDTPSKKTLWLYMVPLLSAHHQHYCVQKLGLPDHIIRSSQSPPLPLPASTCPTASSAPVSLPLYPSLPRPARPHHPLQSVSPSTPPRLGLPDHIIRSSQSPPLPLPASACPTTSSAPVSLPLYLSAPRPARPHHPLQPVSPSNPPRLGLPDHIIRSSQSPPLTLTAVSNILLQ